MVRRCTGGSKWLGTATKAPVRMSPSSSTAISRSSCFFSEIVSGNYFLLSETTCLRDSRAHSVTVKVLRVRRSEPGTRLKLFAVSNRCMSVPKFALDKGHVSQPWPRRTSIKEG